MNLYIMTVFMINLINVKTRKDNEKKNLLNYHYGIILTYIESQR